MYHVPVITLLIRRDSRNIDRLSASAQMMATIEILPREVLLQIFSLLPYSDLVSVGRTCKHWHGLGKDYALLQMIVKREFSWSDGDYYPTRKEIGYAVFLENSGHLPQQILSSLAARITEQWNEFEMECYRYSTTPSLPQLASPVLQPRTWPAGDW